MHLQRQSLKSIIHSYATFSVFLVLGLCACFFFSVSFSTMFLSDGTVISISLQVEFTESLTMMSGLFAVIVLSVLLLLLLLLLLYF